MPSSGIMIDHSKLTRWVKNYHENRDLGFLTENAAISLEQLENFIAEAKKRYPTPRFNAIKIYFVRYPLNDHNTAIEKEKSKNFSVPSLVFVPVENADRTTWSGEDFKLKDEKIFVLPFCNPESPDETGICPPKCGKKGLGG